MQRIEKVCEMCGSKDVSGKQRFCAECAKKRKRENIHKYTLRQKIKRNRHKSNIKNDAAAAMAAGMSYGEYMARKGV